MVQKMASLNKGPSFPQPWRRSVALLLHLSLWMVDTTQARRTLQTSQPQLRLQPYWDNTDTPKHAPAAQSYLLSDGSWVDCIPIEGQIAAHHPTLKDHIIKLRPSELSDARPSFITDLHPQLFAREHGGCPDGSIPVQRMDPDRPRFRKEFSPQAPISIPAVAGVHEYAVTHMPKSSGAYKGAAASASVNAPYVANITEFSLSQFWISDGSYSDNTLSTIEVGWQTYPQRHTGNAAFLPHLFVYWTKDAYIKTGCYDLECPGFVQIQKSWVIGGSMPSYSTLAQSRNGSIVEVHVQVLNDAMNKVWWLYLNGVPIGYWPELIFSSTTLQGTASQVEWGGEVVVTKTNSTAHSKTAMGSGEFPTAGFPRTAFYRNITYADAKTGITNVPASVDSLTSLRYQTNPDCYGLVVQLNRYINWGTYFFFGGPGGNNAACTYKP